jgi:aminoglycoside N3'-acetyltransferase
MEKYLIDHFNKLEINKNDNIIVYSKLSSFGLIDKNFVKVLTNFIIKYVGQKGTIIMPSYTFNKDKRFVFDIKKIDKNYSTSLVVKDFFKNKNIIRSFRPIHSHIGMGPKSHFLKKTDSFNSFGKNSDFFYFNKYNFKSIFLGCTPEEAATFLIHLEYINNVPYRNKIILEKKIKINNKIKNIKIDYFDKPNNIKFDFNAAFKKIEKLGLKTNKANLRFGTSVSFKIKDLSYYANILFKTNKYCLVKNFNEFK